MEISGYISDVVMEAPHAFSTDTKSYRLYPLSLGKLMLIQRELDSMGVDKSTIAQWPILEVIKIVSKHRDKCILLIVYATARTKEECFDIKRINNLSKELSNSLSDEDIATLLIYILTCEKSDEIFKHYGIDKEQEALSSVSRVKSRGNSISFGGKTIFGTMIDQACERYGWTVDYVVWGLSYTVLKLMLADKINSIFLSDEEKRKVPASVLQKDESVIKATKENMDIIKSMSWK